MILYGKHERELFIQIVVIHVCFFLMLFSALSYCHAQTAPPLPEQKDSLLVPEIKGNDYYYDPNAKRDPFYSKLLFDDGKDKKKDDDGFGLKKYDPSELKLGGIVWNASEKKASIEAPDGKSYIITIGAPVGKKDGVVKEITDKEVLIQEFTINYLGIRTEKITTLKLKSKEQF